MLGWAIGGCETEAISSGLELSSSEDDRRSKARRFLFDSLTTRLSAMEVDGQIMLLELATEW